MLSVNTYRQIVHIFNCRTMALSKPDKYAERIHESFWPGGEKESIVDKRHNAMFLINGISKLLSVGFEGLGLAKYTKLMRDGVEFYKSAYIHLNRIASQYVRKETTCFERRSAWAAALKYQEASKKILNVLSESVPYWTNPTKLDSITFRLIRPCKDVDQGVAYFAQLKKIMGKDYVL